MKILKAASFAVFIASLILLGVSVFKEKAVADTPGPEIKMDAELIAVSVKDGEEALIKGVTATDAKGNDVTDLIVVESIGPFDEHGHRVVTYVAFDAENHLTRAQRELIYTDYTSPRFHFERPLSFPIDWYNLLNGVTVEDCLGGDRAANIWIQYDGIIDTSVAGEYSVVLETENNAGDISRLPVTIELYDESVKAGLPKIELKEYVVYLDQGAAWDPKVYPKSAVIGGTEYVVTAQGGTYGANDAAEADANANADQTDKSGKIPVETIGIDKIKVDGKVDTNTPGSYEVVYSFEDTESMTGTGSVRLYVVVTEGGEAK